MCRAISEERNPCRKGGASSSQLPLVATSVVPLAPFTHVGTLGAPILDTRVGPAVVDVVTIEAPMVDTMVTVPYVHLRLLP
jgi:hypothetical protein